MISYDFIYLPHAFSTLIKTEMCWVCCYFSDFIGQLTTNQNQVYSVIVLYCFQMITIVPLAMLLVVHLAAGMKLTSASL